MDRPTLHVRRVGIDTWRESVAYLHRDCPVVRAAGFQALAKVTVNANGQSIAAVLNVVDDERIVAPCDLGLSEDAFARLKVAEGHAASIEHAEPAASIAALHRKIAGERLTRDDLAAIVRDIASARYSKIELAAFGVATNQFELDRDEVLHLVLFDFSLALTPAENIRAARTRGWQVFHFTAATRNRLPARLGL